MKSEKKFVLTLVITIVLTITYGMVLIYFGKPIRSSFNKDKVRDAKTPNEFVIKTMEDSIHNMLFSLRIKHPDVVMAQCIEESGNFSSRLFIEGNNCIGMKVPSTRPTLAVGVLYGHARFNSWKECLIDFAIWQSTFCRGMTKEEYLSYLDRVYAEKKDYSKRLITIIQSKKF